MFKIEIDISEWDFGKDVVTIATEDFSKIEIIAEFIEFQQLHGWCVDYDVTDEYEYNQCDEEEEEEVSEDEEYEDESDEYEESEEFEIGEIVEDEDGLVWVRVS
jgi:hypothetical protein